MQFGINIVIDDTALLAIYNAGQTVALVRSIIANPQPQLTVPIAWLAIRPVQNNSVSWTDSYYLYATPINVWMPGSPIVPSAMSDMPGPPGPAQPGAVYSFSDETGFSVAPGSGSGFRVINTTPYLFRLGLAQPSSLNGPDLFFPLYSQEVPPNEEVEFTPLEAVSIFLSLAQDNGTPVPEVPRNALVVNFSSQTPFANIGFNHATKTFFLQS